MVKVFFIKLFLSIFIILTFLVDISWLLGSRGFGGLLVIVLPVNIIAIYLSFVVFKNKKKIIVTPEDELKKVKRVFVLAGVSAICLSNMFFFYSWSLIVGHELTPLNHAYYGFTMMLIEAFGPYFTAFVNLLVGLAFIYGGFKFIVKKVKKAN